MRGRFSAIDPAALQRMIEQEMLTQHAAAAAIGCSVSAVERACKRLGLRTQRTGPRSGERHTGWKGGRIRVGRYWYLWVGTAHPMATKAGYVAEHRLRVAEVLERPLLRGEVVHHIDGDPDNNSLDNLMMFGSNADHLRHELTGRTPAHTPEGRARMTAGVKAYHSRRRSERDAQATLPT